MFPKAEGNGSDHPSLGWGRHRGLPVRSGAELCHVLRANEWLPKTLISYANEWERHPELPGKAGEGLTETRHGSRAKP